MRNVVTARYTRSNYSTSESGSTDTAAIVGGVVGTVAGLSIICVIIIFFLIRRKRRNREAAWNQESRKDIYLEEMDGSERRSEMWAKHDPAEHDGSPIHELDGRRRSGALWP